MTLPFDQLSPLALFASVVVGQILSTVWFVVLFGEPWAREYGVASKAEHTRQIPGYTYAVQVACTIALSVSLALLQKMAGVEGVGGALGLGLWVALGFALATGLPGLAFLKRWRTAAITYGNQTVMILGISLVLALLG